MNILGKKIVMVIASSNFRDEEYEVPKQILEQAGAIVITASSNLNPSKGILGAVVNPDKLLSEIKADDYDCLIFVGGNGSSEYWHDPTAHFLAIECVEARKVLGAICIAPVTLANAGVLKDKRATVFPSEVSKLRAKGAKYSGKDLEIDSKIITASGPAVAAKFGEAVRSALT